MEVFKWILLIAVIAFAIWQIVLLARNVIERQKNKKAKQEQKLDETKVMATDNVDKKEEN